MNSFKLTHNGIYPASDVSGIASAVSFCQRFSDEFREFEQPVSVDEVDDGIWRCLQDVPGGNETRSVGPADASKEELVAYAATENKRIADEIVSDFPEILIPDGFDVAIGSSEHGKYPQSRSVDVTVNWRSAKLSWDARGATDTWLPLEECADLVRDLVEEELKLLKHADQHTALMRIMIDEFQSAHLEAPSLIPLTSFDSEEDFDRILEGKEQWSFEEHRAVNARIRANLERDGFKVEMVLIVPEEYFAWLKSKGIDNAPESRSRYIAEKVSADSELERASLPPPKG